MSELPSRGCNFLYWCWEASLSAFCGRLHGGWSSPLYKHRSHKLALSKESRIKWIIHLINLASLFAFAAFTSQFVSIIHHPNAFHKIFFMGFILLSGEVPSSLLEIPNIHYGRLHLGSDLPHKSQGSGFLTGSVWNTKTNRTWHPTEMSLRA